MLSVNNFYGEPLRERIIEVPVEVGRTNREGGQRKERGRERKRGRPQKIREAAEDKLVIIQRREEGGGGGRGWDLNLRTRNRDGVGNATTPLR